MLSIYRVEWSVVVRIMGELVSGGGDMLSNWLPFGEKEAKVGELGGGLQMNGEHYTFYGSQLNWRRSRSTSATVTFIFPSVEIVPHVYWPGFRGLTNSQDGQ